MPSAAFIFNCFFSALLVAFFAIVQTARAGDPDIVTDFVLPPNINAADGSFFTFTGIRTLVGAPPPPVLNVTRIGVNEFPALNGQSVSYAILRFAPGTINPHHIHPRASELIFVVEGWLQVGFVDTTNKFYTQILQKGDMFIFPKGLVHFQFNPDGYKNAFAISAFGSANPGTVLLPNTLFTTGIDDAILAKAFKTDVAIIQALQMGLKGEP